MGAAGGGVVAAAAAAVAAAGLLSLRCCGAGEASGSGSPTEAAAAAATVAAAPPGGSAPPPGAEQPTPPPPPSSLLATLGLEGRERVTDADIKKAYIKLARQHHPDRISSSGGSEQELAAATEKFAAIQAAYEILSGEDQSVTEAAGRSMRAKQPGEPGAEDSSIGGGLQVFDDRVTGVVGETQDVAGEVIHTRRHGKGLTFSLVRVDRGNIAVDVTAVSTQATHSLIISRNVFERLVVSHCL